MLVGCSGLVRRKDTGWGGMTVECGGLTADEADRRQLRRNDVGLRRNDVGLRWNDARLRQIDDRRHLRHKTDGVICDG